MQREQLCHGEITIRMYIYDAKYIYAAIQHTVLRLGDSFVSVWEIPKQKQIKCENWEIRET